MNVFLKIIGWSYIISILLAYIIDAGYIYLNPLENISPWKSLTYLYSPVRLLEGFCFLIPGILLLAIRDLKIKLQEKKLQDSLDELKDNQITDEQMYENYCKNGQFRPCCKGK